MGGGEWTQKQHVQQIILDKAYDAIEKKIIKDDPKEESAPPPTVEPKPDEAKVETKEAKEQKVESIEVDVKKPDIGDNTYVLIRTYCPDWLFVLIAIAGIYAVFKKPINAFMTTVFGFNFEDLKNTVKRRKERDKELNNKK
jgi:hypothetical protein